MIIKRYCKSFVNVKNDVIFIVEGMCDARCWCFGNGLITAFIHVFLIIYTLYVP